MITVTDVHFTYRKTKSFFSRKKAKSVPILRDINVTLESGSLFGLIGPNGSGKTTFTKLIMGVYNPDEGKILYNDKYTPSLKNAKWKNMIGWISGANSRLFTTIDLNEHLVLYKNLYPSFDEVWFMEKMVEFNLDKKLDRLPSAISFGERIKFEIAITLAYSPKVIVLDEPTVGLDPIAIKEIRAIIKEYLKSHPEVCGILTSHNLDDIIEISDQYAFLHKGTFLQPNHQLLTSAYEIEAQYIQLYGGGM